MASIDELALNYGCSVVLCTATQPALKDSDEFHNGFRKVQEIAPNPQELFEKLRRTQVQALGVQSDEQLVAHLRSHTQVLMIVNNRRHARELFDGIAKEVGAYHLTTSMCAEHRSEQLTEIRQRLKDGLACRLVATSLIEAGVDVDFPTVYRAEAGLDSIAQAAGRCNREGRRLLADSQVYVFQSPDWKAPPELAQLAAPMRSILRNHEGDVLSPKALKSIRTMVSFKTVLLVQICAATRIKETPPEKVDKSAVIYEICAWVGKGGSKRGRREGKVQVPLIGAITEMSNDGSLWRISH
jgi:CRISPR-associated endonuclease/helicase Cas3